MSLKKKVLAKYEIIAGRKERFKEMLKPFYENPGDTKYDRPEFWDHILPKAIKGLKLDDRIVWFLKKARGTRPVFLKDKSEATNDPRSALTSASIEDFLDRLIHFVDNAEVNNYKSVLNFQFKNKKIAEVLDQLEKLTAHDEENTKAEARLVPQGEDKTFLKFKDGWEWHLLDRASCKQEGAAMRHCGNSAAGKSGQKILSLREPVAKKGKKLWKPHATFIWNPDGILGEMKGYANEKPKEEVHPYIVELLKNHDITKLKGGGYASNKNFKISDLAPALKDKLAETRNDLVDTTHKEADIDALVERINDLAANQEEWARNPTENDMSYYLLENLDLSEAVLIRRLEDDDYNNVKMIKDLDADWESTLKDMMEVEHTAGYGRVTNELNSLTIGEHSFQMDDDLTQELAELSEEQFEEVQRRVDCYISDNREDAATSLDDERFSLILSSEAIQTKLDELLDEKFNADLDLIENKVMEENIDVNSLKISKWNDEDISLYYGTPDGDETIYAIDFDDKDYMESFLKTLKENITKYNRGGEFRKEEPTQPTA